MTTMTMKKSNKESLKAWLIANTEKRNRMMFLTVPFKISKPKEEEMLLLLRREALIPTEAAALLKLQYLEGATR